VPAIDASHEPQRAHGIPSAATEFPYHFKATSNKPSSQCTVLKPAKKGEPSRGKDEDSTGTSWPGIDQLQQRLMMATKIDARANAQ
jgi:hypothetical protein